MTDDHTYNTESLHTPESRERDARLVGHEWKGEAIGDDPKCEAGCISYYGGEKKHHKDCPYYPESLTKLNADRIEALLAERDSLREEAEGAHAVIAVERAEVVKLREENARLRGGYAQALVDFEERLDNAIENGGGIHWGKEFIPRAHFDHELRDEIAALKGEQP